LTAAFLGRAPDMDAINIQKVSCTLTAGTKILCGDLLPTTSLSSSWLAPSSSACQKTREPPRKQVTSRQKPVRPYPVSTSQRGKLRLPLLKKLSKTLQNHVRPSKSISLGTPVPVKQTTRNQASEATAQMGSVRTIGCQPEGNFIGSTRSSRPIQGLVSGGRAYGQVRRMKPEATRLPGIIPHIGCLSSNFRAIFSTTRSTSIPARFEGFCSHF
jgi:hypothetical protein